MSFFQEARRLEEAGEEFVVVTFLSSRGHAPQDAGAKAIVQTSGLVWGTVGGGKLEAKAIRLAQEILLEKKNSPQYCVWNLQRDVGMSCGGEVEMLFEPFTPHPWKIVVFGAGHVAQALVRQLLPLACVVTCVDHRKEWLARLPAASNLRVLFWEDQNYLPELPRDAFFVVMTQGHTTDLPVLEKILRAQVPPYIGVLGSPVKAIKIKKELLALGISALAVEALRCPMGLEIGNSNHPPEIAVSIAAELIQRRGG